MTKENEGKEQASGFSSEQHQVVDALRDILGKHTARQRVNDNGSKRAVVWDEPTREVITSFVEEIAKAMHDEAHKALGVPYSTHKSHHDVLLELIPWLRAQREQAQKKAEFWNKLTNDIAGDSVKFIARWGLLILLAATTFAVSSATGLINKLLGGP